MKKILLPVIVSALIVAAAWYAFGGMLEPPLSEDAAVRQAPVVAISPLLTRAQAYEKKMITVSGTISRECPRLLVVYQGCQRRNSCLQLQQRDYHQAAPGRPTNQDRPGSW